MEAQAPEWGQGGAAYDAGQLLQHCSWSWAHHDVEINHASSHTPAQPVFADDDFHGIAVQQQDAMAAAICSHIYPVSLYSTGCTTLLLQYVAR